MSDVVQQAEQQHNERIAALLEATMPGAGERFLGQIKRADEPVSTATERIHDAFEAWWEAEGDMTLFRGLANNDGDVMRVGKLVAHMAWTAGAIEGMRAV